MRYQCTRCKADLNHLDPAHLCADVESRLKEHRNRRRSYLLRLVRGKRCPKHGTVLQVVCGVKSCGMCWIEQPFRPAPKFAPLPEAIFGKKFAGYGAKTPKIGY